MFLSYCNNIVLNNDSPLTHRKNAAGEGCLQPMTMNMESDYNFKAECRIITTAVI